MHMKWGIDVSGLHFEEVLGADLEKHISKIWVGEFKMPLIIKLEESWTIRMIILKVKVVNLRLICSVTTLLTNIHLKEWKKKFVSLETKQGTVRKTIQKMSFSYLCAALLVCILMLNSMYFQTVRLKRASLGKGFLTEIAFIWANTCNTTQIEMIKSFVQYCSWCNFYHII